MSQSDIYAPPTASVAGPTPAELSAKANGEVVIAGAGRRIGATLVDGMVMTPLFVADAYVGALGRGPELAMFVLYQIVTLFVYVGMVRLYGGTPGKLLLGMRVAMADGGPLTWKAAILRYSVYEVLCLALGVAQIVAALAMPDETYLTLGYFGRAAALNTQMPAWAGPVNYILFGWMFACFISMLVTKRNRTLYDFQAGTIVVRSH